MPTLAKQNSMVGPAICLLVALIASLSYLDATAVPAPAPRLIPGIQLPPCETPGNPMILSESNRLALSRLVDADREGLASRGTVECLAILAEFPDRTFLEDYQEDFDPLNVLGYPDSVISTPRGEWFENALSRVSEYFESVSGGVLQINWTLIPDPVLMSGNMADYGRDDLPWVHGVSLLVREVVDSLDATVDFSLYDQVTVIHAGPGQESDLQRDSPEQIWSGYIDYESLVESFADSIPDPPLDGFPGIATDDQGGGYVLQHFAIAPESEVEEQMSPPYVLGPLGVYVHQMGSFLGLLNLNDYLDPRGQGAGNYDLMSSGLWNALGFVPGPPSAFNRMLMGWVAPVEISQADCAGPDGLTLTINSMDQATDSTLLKLPISGREYFLIENREQDFHGDGVFTFDDTNGNHVPDNGESLLGAEFDYFTTQYDASDIQPGSGLFIWRIDEEMIHLTFAYNTNLINGYNDHYGVCLLEADGYPDLSTPGLGGDSYGGDYDAFRSGGNGLPRTQDAIGRDTFPNTRSVEGADSGWRLSAISGHGTRMELNATWVAGLDRRSLTIPGVLAVGDPLVADIFDEGEGREEFIFVATNVTGDSTLVFAFRDSLSLVDPDGDPTTFDPLITLAGTPVGSPAAGDLDGDGLADLVMLRYYRDGDDDEELCDLFGWSMATGAIQSLAGGAPDLPLASVESGSVGPILYDVDGAPGGVSPDPQLEILVAEVHPGGEDPDSTGFRWFRADGSEFTEFSQELGSVWGGVRPGLPVGEMALSLEVAPGSRGIDHPEPDGVWVNIPLVDYSDGGGGRVLRLRVQGGDGWVGDGTPEMELPFQPVFDTRMNLVSGDLDADGVDELIIEAEGRLLIWYPRGRFQGDQAGTELFTVDHVGQRGALALAPFDLDGNGSLEVLACETTRVIALSADAVLLDDWIIDLTHTDPDPGAYTDPVIWPITLRDDTGRDHPMLFTRDGRFYDGPAALRGDEAVMIGGNLVGSPLLTVGGDGALEIQGVSAFEPLEGTTAVEDTLLTGARTSFWRVITGDTSGLQDGSWRQGGADSRRLRRVSASGPLTLPTAGSGEFISAYGYPNPAAESVTWRVETSGPESFTIRLFDLEGQLRLQLSGNSDGFSPWEKRSRLVGLASGVYFYIIQADGSGPQRTGRLAVIR